ncbi:hypothetical protein [Vibrio lentus]|uniref:hypothetical protein n=1 Tax=Vibrio lentus TaxID=136468 RepID=UPI001E3BE128|nr:hypothetical protein [Vibrio lentus]MCC4838075.1 hypothetical protein [Vibrio lentus]
MRFVSVMLIMLGFVGKASAFQTDVTTEGELMGRYVNHLESDVIANSVDIYDREALFESLRSHRIYLALCDDGIAISKCEDAKKYVPILEKNWRAHAKFIITIGEVEQSVLMR